MEAATGFPGYDSVMQKDTATVAEMLKQNGYGTAWFGKNHNVPDWQTSQAGPFDLWPTGLGFDHFYGFIGGDTNQWRPAVTEGTKPIEPYLGKPDYNFDYDMADQAIKWIKMQKAVAPDKPFFCYYAPGATHAPHHPKKEWVEKYKGKFDQGWDKVREETFDRQKKLGVIPADAKLTPRAPGVQAWDTLTAEQKKVFARFMEVYAGYLEQTDYNVGRVLEAIEEVGQTRQHARHLHRRRQRGQRRRKPARAAQRDDVLQRREGRPQARCSSGSTTSARGRRTTTTRSAGRTPCAPRSSGPSRSPATTAARATAWSSRGRRGSRPRASSAPSGTTASTSCRRFSTSCGRAAPTSVNGVTQKPIEGVSMAYTFADAKAPSTRTTQYFEMLGNRAIYHDGWVACTTPLVPPWEPGAADGGRDHRLQVGALRHRQGLLAGRQPGRTRCRRSSRSCSSCSTPRRPSTTCCRSTTARPRGSTRPSARA